MAAGTPPFFAIQGNIGSGKTTLLKRMAERQVPVHLVTEPVEVWQKLGKGGSNILDLFYKNPQEWAMPFQLTTLITRLQKWGMYGCHQPALSERSIEGDFQIFGKEMNREGFMTDKIYDVYFHIYQGYRKLFSRFDTAGIVYLRTSPQVCHTRQLRRKREEEGGITLEYLTQLHDRHEEWLSSETLNKRVLVLDGDQDVQNDPAAIDAMIDKILAFINEKSD